MIMQPSLFGEESFGERFFSWFDEFKRKEGRVPSRTECVDQLNHALEAHDKTFRGPNAKIKRTERDAIFEALCDFEGVDWRKITPSAAVQVSKHVSEILSATPDVTPAEVTKRGKAYARTYPTAARTSRALVSHWARLEVKKRDAGPDWVSLAYGEPPENWRALAQTKFGSSFSDDANWADISHSIRVDILRAGK